MNDFNYRGEVNLQGKGVLQMSLHEKDIFP